MLVDGQKFATPLGYAPLPAPVIAREQQALPQIQVGGQ